MDKFKDKKVLGIIALVVVVVVFISLLVINNNKTDEEPNTTLTIEKAGTFVLGDQYEEVIINVPDVVLEDGTVDKILVAKSVGDGEVTFNNVNATELKLEGGGPNSIIISGDSTIKAVRLERVDGTIRVVVTDSSNVETVTAYEGSQDVILEGTFNDLAIEASNINVSIKNSTVKSLSVSGNSSKITVDESAELDDVTILAKADEASLIMNGRAKKIVVESKNSTIDLNKGSVDTIDVKDDAENTTIILGEKATVKTLTTNIPTTVNGDGKLDEIVTDIADNVQGTAKADKVTLTKEPEEDDTKPKPEVSKPAPKPDPKPTPKPEPEKPVVDASSYNEAVASLPTSNEGGKYTKDSWKNFETAKNAVKLDLTADAGQEALDSETNKIKEAKNKLVLAGVATFDNVIDSSVVGSYNLILKQASVKQKFANINTSQPLVISIEGVEKIAEYESTLYYKGEAIGAGWLVYDIQGFTESQIKSGLVNLK